MQDSKPIDGWYERANQQTYTLVMTATMLLMVVTTMLVTMMIMNHDADQIDASDDDYGYHDNYVAPATLNEWIHAL